MQKGSPPNVKKSSSQFLFYLEEFNKFLVDITDNKILVTLSLKELSNLQSVKSLLDQVHYLNLVYHENSKIKFHLTIELKLNHIFLNKGNILFKEIWKTAN